MDELISNMIFEALTNLHTATVGRVEAVNDNNTVSIKPCINRLVDGKSIELPIFTDVPCFVLQGGISFITMPISVGDYALLVFSERCIDSWWAGSDSSTPLEYRIHDYSDGFAFVGFNPLSFLIPTSDDIHINGDVSMVGNLSITGNLNVTGTITADVDVIGGGISLKNHTHTSSTSGTPTSPPIGD